MSPTPPGDPIPGIFGERPHVRGVFVLGFLPPRGPPTTVRCFRVVPVARSLNPPSPDSVPARYMDKKLRLKLNGNRGVVGILRGFDQFLNLVLDEATSDNGDEEPLGMVVVRGNSVTAMEALEHIPAAVRKA